MCFSSLKNTTTKMQKVFIQEWIHWSTNEEIVPYDNGALDNLKKNNDQPVDSTLHDCSECSELLKECKKKKKKKKKKSYRL